MPTVQLVWHQDLLTAHDTFLIDPVHLCSGFYHCIFTTYTVRCNRHVHMLCYLLSLPSPVIQVPSSVPAASPRNSGKTYSYPVSPDNSSYISSSLPRFRKSQFSLSQSTDQFAHLFVLRLYFLYHNINITKKLVSSLKINTFLFPNGFLPSVLQFPHQDNPEDNFSDLPACPDALL